MRRAIRFLMTAGAAGMIVGAANAAVVITIPSSEGYTTGSGTAVVNEKSLHDFSVFVGATSQSVSGSFTFSSTLDTIIGLSAQVKTTGVSLGTLTFGASIASPATSLLAATVSESAGNEASLGLASQATPLSLAPLTTYTLNWSATFTGTSTASYAYITQASFLVTEKGTRPVPEPASLFAVGLGALGLIARRRKGSN